MLVYVVNVNALFWQIIVYLSSNVQGDTQFLADANICSYAYTIKPYKISEKRTLHLRYPLFHL